MILKSLDCLEQIIGRYMDIRGDSAEISERMRRAVGKTSIIAENSYMAISSWTESR